LIVDIIVQESTNFSSISDEFKQDKTVVKEEAKIEKNQKSERA